MFGNGLLINGLGRLRSLRKAKCCSIRADLVPLTRIVCTMFKKAVRFFVTRRIALGIALRHVTTQKLTHLP